MLSIILLTLAVSAAAAPLTYISMRSQRRMAAIQPRLAELRSEHGNDRARLASETTDLLKSSGVTPLGGCLPMLVQAPVFILMFRHVRQMAKAGLSFGQVDLAQTGVAALHAGPAAIVFVAVIVLVILGTALVQTRLSSTSAVAARTPSERAVRAMPLLFGAWAVALPLAVGVYYATSSVFRAALQWGITRHMST